MTTTKTAATPTTWLGQMLASISNVFTHEAWPFIANLFHTIQLDVQAKLAPIAENALGTLEGDIPVLLTGGQAAFLTVFNALVAAVWQQVEGEIPGVAMTDVITACHATLVNKQKALATPAA